VADIAEENVEEHEGVSRSARTFTMSQLLRSFYLRQRREGRPISRQSPQRTVPARSSSIRLDNYGESTSGISTAFQQRYFNLRNVNSDNNDDTSRDEEDTFFAETEQVAKSYVDSIRIPECWKQEILNDGTKIASKYSYSKCVQ